MIDPTAAPTPESVAYRARALAQAHPLSSQARRYLDWAIAEQRASQPVPDVGNWASNALLLGYCVRRVEEEDLNLGLAQEPDHLAPSVEDLDQAAAHIAAEVRGGPTTEGSPSSGLGHRDQADEDRLIRALDRVVASEVDKRLDHWRDTVDDSAWAELSEYITWWLVKGYAVRVAETRAGAVSP